jgi:hypothetical protein
VPGDPRWAGDVRQIARELSVEDAIPQELLSSLAEATGDEVFTLLESLAEEVHLALSKGDHKEKDVEAEAVPRLISTLSNRDAEAVREAICTLGLIGPASRDAIPSLVRLLGDDRWEDKANVLRALGGLGHEAEPALPHMVAYLTDQDPELRRVAAEAVSRVNPQGDLLISELRSQSAGTPAESDANVFRKEGSLWRITFAHKTNRFRDLKGFGYIHHLVSRPGKPIHVGDLAAAMAGPADVRAVWDRSRNQSRFRS